MFKTLSVVPTGKVDGQWRQVLVTYDQWVAVAIPCGRWERVERLEWEFVG